jgi:hypothetical protein
MTDATRLNQIRARLSQLGGVEFAGVYDGDLRQVESVSGAGERLVIADMRPLASFDEMQVLSHALADMRFLVALVDRAVKRINELVAASPEGQAAAVQKGRVERKAKLASECAMLCGTRLFGVYLAENHGFEGALDDAAIAQHVRALLRISSRAEIDHDAVVAAGWKQLRGDFYAWKRMADPWEVAVTKGAERMSA